MLYLATVSNNIWWPFNPAPQRPKVIEIWRLDPICRDLYQHRWMGASRCQYSPRKTANFCSPESQEVSLVMCPSAPGGRGGVVTPKNVDRGVRPVFFRNCTLGYGDLGPKLYPWLRKMGQNHILDNRKCHQINHFWSNFAWNYWLNSRPWMFPSDLTLAMTLTLNFQGQMWNLQYQPKIVRLPRTEKQTYCLYSRPWIWPWDLTLAMTLTLSFQGQI